MTQLGNGLSVANRAEEALSVREAELAMKRRLGAPEDSILVAQSNLACTYQKLGRHEEANRMLQDVYSGYLKIMGEEHSQTLSAANNYANALANQERLEEAKALLRKVTPVARRVLGESHELTLQMRGCYATALYKDPAATEDDLREAVAMFEDAGRIARRVFGGSHPLTGGIERSLRNAQAALRFRETGDVESIREGVAAMTAKDA